MVSVIIVNYNSGPYLRRCLASLSANIKGSFEVIVVDNSSSDNSLENLPLLSSLTVIRLEENLGFARSCNLGAKRAQGRVLHFLNPDTELVVNMDPYYHQIATNMDPYIFVTKIQDMSGHPVQSSFVLPTLTDIAKSVFGLSGVRKWYIGASLVMKTDIFWQLGGFSEDYFMYAEDLDLFYKAVLAGINTAELPVSVKHVSGGSTQQIWTTDQRLERVERSALIFARKFNLQLQYFIFKHLAFVKNFSSDPKEAFRSLRVYWRCWFKGPRTSV